MGTSISHRSPSTPNWSAVAAAYTSPEISINRVVEEVWRAAINQPTGNLADDLANPIISKCLQIASEASTPQVASKQILTIITQSGQASLAIDIAQRATVYSAKSQYDRVEAFVASLFSQAADYLVSRDLPGYVGIGERLKNITDTINFKDNVRKEVENIVRGIPRPEGMHKDPAIWKIFVEKVISSLAGKR
jgi:hypothetical protein